MNIYEKLFPNIKRILDSGKDSVVKDPVQFGVNIPSSNLPTSTLPKTANSTKPVDTQAFNIAKLPKEIFQGTARGATATGSRSRCRSSSR